MIKYSFSKPSKIFLGIAILIVIFFCRCEPENMFDPIPEISSFTIISYAANDFAYGTLGIESAVPILKEENIDFNKEIIIHKTLFSIERHDVNVKEPYIIFIGRDLQRNTLFSDTVNVSDDNYTEITYEKQNIWCSDPIWMVTAQHPVKIYVEMTIYAFKK